MEKLIEAMLKVNELLDDMDDVLGVNFDDNGIITIHVEAKNVDANLGKRTYTQRGCKFFPWEKSVLCENGKVKIFGLLTERDMQKEFTKEDENND